MDKVQAIRFDLISIVTDEFAVPEENYDFLNDSQVNVGFSFNVSIESRVIIVRVKCRFYQDNKLSVIVAVAFAFQIHPVDWETLYNDPANKITLPLETALQMSSMSVGAMRGIVYDKTENVLMNPIILPSINLNDIFKEDVSIDPLSV